MSDLRRILITGATGKQGGSLLSALLASQPNPPFHLVAMTRDAKSSRAQALAQKPNVSVIEGDLDNIDAVFRQSSVPFYGVFSVQTVSKIEVEERQGKSLIDAAVANNVQHFVYSSVERGGSQRSNDNPTKVHHFMSKHNIEQHLKTVTSQTSAGMQWTIIRPVAFMDNFTNDFIGKAFGSIWQMNGMDRKLQFVAARDIGILAAEAFKRPTRFNGQAISLATDELSPREANAIFERVTGKAMPTTFTFLAKFIKWVFQAELGVMFDWFAAEGFGASVSEIRTQYPQMKDFETWLREESAFRKN